MSGVLLILAATTLVLNSRNPIGRDIGFQAHSYNDMRSWYQLFLKGATHIKIDPNYRPQDFCADQLRVHNKTDPRGCFVLNHDTPTLLPPNYRRGYNTTDDVLAVLEDREGPLYAFLIRPSVRIYFALCFKTIPLNVCDQKSPASQHWRSLVDQLVSSFLKLVSHDPALNVEFVLDSGVPQRCFLQRWRPLVGTSSPFPQQVPLIPDATCILKLYMSDVKQKRGLQSQHAHTPPRLSTAPSPPGLRVGQRHARLRPLGRAQCQLASRSAAALRGEEVGQILHGTESLAGGWVGWYTVRARRQICVHRYLYAHTYTHLHTHTHIHTPTHTHAQTWKQYTHAHTLGGGGAQVYEPCDQKDFLSASAVYVGAGVAPPAGLKFAINVDVAMSEVFLSNATGRGLNEHLFCGSDVVPVGIRIAVLSPAGNVFNRTVMLALTQAHVHTAKRLTHRIETFNKQIQQPNK